MHSVAARREGENMGVGFTQFTWGLDATQWRPSMEWIQDKSTTTSSSSAEQTPS